MKILVAYASGFGTTAEVSAFIVKILEKEGVDVEEKPIKDVASIRDFDVVIIGSPIRYDHWMKDAREFVVTHQAQLSKIPVAYFFTCLALAKKTDKTLVQAQQYADKIFTLSTEVKPIDVGQFSGVLKYKLVPLLMRPAFWLLSAVTGVSEGDYRDWGEIEAWTQKVYKMINS